MNEKTLQDFLLKKCKKFDILAYKTVAVGRRGFPDVTICHAGRVIFIELKHPNGKGRLSVQQSQLITQLREQQIDVRVYHTKEEIEQLITELRTINNRPTTGH